MSGAALALALLAAAPLVREFPEGTVVELTATTASGVEFVGWTKAPPDDAGPSTELVLEVELRGDTAIGAEARRVAPPSVTLTVETSGEVTVGLRVLKLPGCGDGLRRPPFEQCDDGNELDGDGCSSVCELEPRE